MKSFLGLWTLSACLLVLAMSPHANMLVGGTGAPSGIAFVQSAGTFCGSAGTTCAASLTGTTSGNFIGIAAFLFNTGGSPAFSAADNSGTNCPQATNSLGSTNVAGEELRVVEFYCQNNPASGSRTFTVNTVATVAGMFTCAMEFSGLNTSGSDAGLANTVAFGSPTTPWTLALTGGTLPKSNELVIANTLNHVGSTITSYGANQITPGPCSPSVTYQIINSSGSTATQTFNWNAGDDGLLSVAAFLRP